MKRYAILGTLSVAMLSFASGNAWSQQQNAIDCSTAKTDIIHLEHEKKSTDERVMKGVMGIMPIGLVVNEASHLTHRGSKDHMEINEYNKKITVRINEIKKKCDVQSSNSVLDTSTN